ncbi:MAG: SIMPL domain-containing protein [Cellvibrio sp.]
MVTKTIDKQVKPDKAQINFTIIAYEKTSENALDKLLQSSAAILQTMKDHGIDASHIESLQIDKTAKRASQQGVYDLEILGYEFRQDFILKLNDVSKFPDFMNDLFKIDGVKDIDSRFESTQSDKYKIQMLEEVSIKSRKKADTLAQAQFRQVKRVYGMTTENRFGDSFAIFSLEGSPSIYLGKPWPSSYGSGLIITVPEYIKVGQRVTAIYELK